MYTIAIRRKRCVIKFAIKFVPECYKIQKICDKTVHTCPFVFEFVPDQYKIQDMCVKVVSKKPFMLRNCLDRYKTREMCDEAVNACLSALKFVPD